MLCNIIVHDDVLINVYTSSSYSGLLLWLVGPVTLRIVRNLMERTDHDQDLLSHCPRNPGLCGIKYWELRPEHKSQCVLLVLYISPRESVGVWFYRHWFVCLSVTMITKKIVDGFVPNFMGRFLRGKGRPSSYFVNDW